MVPSSQETTSKWFCFCLQLIIIERANFRQETVRFRKSENVGKCGFFVTRFLLQNNFLIQVFLHSLLLKKFTQIPWELSFLSSLISWATFWTNITIARSEQSNQSLLTWKFIIVTSNTASRANNIGLRAKRMWTALDHRKTGSHIFMTWYKTCYIKWRKWLTLGICSFSQHQPQMKAIFRRKSGALKVSLFYS